MASITKESVTNSLRRVNDPDLHRDLVTLNMIKNVSIDGKNISIMVELTTPACPLKDKIKNDCIDAIKADHPDAESINVEMSARVVGAKPANQSILPNVHNTIAVASGKGGVGKSTVAVNLAAALVKEGARVGLLDADIYGPSIPLMLGVNERPRMIETPTGTHMLPVESYGIKLMSIGFLVDDAAPIIWRGPMASGAVKQFMSDVEWGELDYLVFDMPPGTGDIQLTLCQTIPLTGAVIVTTPQEISLADARKALYMFNKVNVPVLGIVENMSYFVAPDSGVKYDIFGTGGGKKLAEETSTEFLGGIPIDPRIRIGGDTGSPIVFAHPDSDQANSVLDIARNMAAQISIRNIQSALSPKMEISIE